MSKLFALVLSGIVTGGLFAILASGLVLTYQVAGRLQLRPGRHRFRLRADVLRAAHCAHWPIVPAALVTILVFAPLLGVLLDVADAAKAGPGRASRRRSWPPSA